MPLIDSKIEEKATSAIERRINALETELQLMTRSYFDLADLVAGLVKNSANVDLNTVDSLVLLKLTENHVHKVIAERSSGTVRSEM